MYIDHKDYLVDSLLAQNHVSVRFGNEFSRDDSPYRIILCKVRDVYKRQVQNTPLSKRSTLPSFISKAVSFSFWL